jgi:hypothetical protein
MPNDLIENINQQVANINQATGEQGLQQLSPLQPITPAQLEEEPVPVDIPEQPPVSPETDALTDIEAQAQQFEVPEPDQFLVEQQQRTQQLADQSQNTLDDYVNSFLFAPTFQDIQNQVIEETGVTGLKENVARYGAQLRSEQESLRKKIDNLQRVGGGLAMGRQAEINKLERDSLSRQSDLALLQLAATEQWEVAQEAADRAVDAMFARQEREMEARRFLYEENKDLFTTAEQRLFETRQSDRERELDAERENERDLKSIKVEALRMAQLNQAPRNIIEAIGKASTPEEVLTAGGQYGAVDMLQRQQLAGQIANQSLARRANLYALAKEGDAKAIQELGFDPSFVPMTQEELDQNEDAYRRNASDQQRIKEMMANTRGISVYTGEITSPIIEGYAQGAEGAITGRIPIVSGAMGILESRRAARSLTTDVDYVVNNLTLDRFVQLKAQGATFGALSEGEWRIIGGAADELATMVVRNDDGSIARLNGTPEEVQEQFNKIAEQYKIAEDRLNREANGSTKNNEIEAAYSQQ